MMGGERYNKARCSKHRRKSHPIYRKTLSSDNETDVTNFTTTTETSRERCCEAPKIKCTCYEKVKDCEKMKDFEKITRRNSLRERVVSILSPAVSAKTLTDILSPDSSDIYQPPRKAKSKKSIKLKSKPPKNCSKRKSRDSDRRARKTTSQRPECSRKRCHELKPLVPPTDLPKCQVCSKVFDSPILLCCGHTFCKSCVTAFVEASNGQSFRCPVCETNIKLSGSEEELFCPNFIMLKKLGLLEDESDDEMLCAVCTRDVVADFYCESCNDILCEGCANAHQVVKFTKNHRIRELDTTTEIPEHFSKRYHCVEHENYILDKYCTTCEKCVCKKCIQQRHCTDKHSFTSIRKAAQMVREDMRRQMYDFNGRAPKLQLALMDIKNSKKTLREQSNTAYAEINESISRMISSLKGHEKTLYKKLEDVCETKSTALKAQKHRLTIHLEKFQALGKVLEELEKHENDIETLQMRSTIRACAESLEDFVIQLDPTKSSVLFNSNEIRFNKELQKHGEIFHYSYNDTIDKESNRKLNKDIEDYYIVSNFNERVSLPLSPNSRPIHNIFLHQDAKSLRAKSNWMIVKSRLPDIIRRSCSRRSRDRSPTRRKFQTAEARRRKARANWMVLQSHMSRLWSPERKKVNVSQRRFVLSNVEQSKRKIKVKVMRSCAIRQRAEANWLLVRSKLSDIVDYGRVTGRVFSSFTARPWKRSSPTIMKLKHFRAITLRARANWSLVASRVDDIAKYPEKIRLASSKANVSWDSYANSLAVNRRRVTRNKYVAGVLRARANWMLVRSRLPDIILYGKYQRYSCIQNSPVRSSSNSPVKQSPSKQSLARSPLLTHLRSFDEKDRSFARNGSRPRQRKEIDKNRKSKLSKIPIRSPRFLKSKTEQSVDSWRKLIQNTSGKKRSSLKSSHKSQDLKSLVRDTREKSSHEALDNWRNLIEYTSTDDNKALDRWGLLVQSTPKKPIIKEDKMPLKNWDILTKNTASDPIKHKTDPSRGWDVLMQNTPVETKLQPSLRSQDVFRNWENLTHTKPIDVQRSLHNWDNLIQGTSPLSHSHNANSEEIDSTRQSEAEQHWNYLFDQAKRDKKQADENWHRLTKNKRPDLRISKVHNSTRAKKGWNKIKASIGMNLKSDQMDDSQAENSSKQAERAYQNWWLLISGVMDTVRSSKKSRGDDVKEKAVDTNAKSHSEASERALDNWTSLIVGTGAESTAENGPMRDSESIANWNRLIDSTNTSSVDELQNHWHNLINATKKAPPYDTMTALHHWEKIIEGRILGEKRRKASKVSTTGIVRPDTLNIMHTSSGGEQNQYKAMADTPPPGVHLLYEKGRSSTPGLQDSKVMHLNIKDNEGNFNNVSLRLASENQSMLSAHLKDNTDGTFTVFCCPSLDGTFSIMISLKTSEEHNETSVLHFKGNFTRFSTEKDFKLACRTISLIRWQLTPGLLTRRGNHIVGRK